MLAGEQCRTIITTPLGSSWRPLRRHPLLRGWGRRLRPRRC
jgi:hypothetical protein